VFNSGAENLLGYRADEMVCKCTPLAFHLATEISERSDAIFREWGTRVQGFEAFAKPARRGEYDGREWTYLREDGAQLTVTLVVTAVRDSSGNLTGILGVATDITGRKKFESALQMSNDRFDLAVQGTNDGIWDWDVVTNEDFFSSRWCELLGYEPGELQGHFRMGNTPSPRGPGAGRGASRGTSTEDEVDRGRCPHDRRTQHRHDCKKSGCSS
jgi:PAS domain S-box-containing protein